MIDLEKLSRKEQVAIFLAAEDDFLTFTQTWFEILQNEKFITNWHHEWICDVIDDVIFDRTKDKNLIINIPPGGTKTELLSIHLPAYTTALARIGKIGKFRSLNISFSDTLVRRNSRRTRDIIDSAEFKIPYGGYEFGVNQAEEWELIDENQKTICKTVSRSIGGAITGTRAGFFGKGYSGHLSLDDVDKVQDMFYATKREKNHRILVGTIRSRRGDKSKDNATPIFLIQQRLHCEDATGFFLSGGMGIENYTHISVPALLSMDYIDGLPLRRQEQCWASVKDSPTRELNGITYRSYWEKVESVSQLVSLMEKDDRVFSAQYQQEPMQSSGQLLDTSWLGRYRDLPLLRWRAVYVDTNSGRVGDRYDYSVFLMAGLGVDNNLYIIDVVRGKWDPQDLLENANKLWNRWATQQDTRNPMRLRYCSIEDKASGSGLIQTMQKQSRIPVKAQPRGAGQNKLIRHYDCYPQIKTGRVFVPYTNLEDGTRISHTRYNNGTIAATTEWVTPFLYELDAMSEDILLDKTSQGYDDQYDCLMDSVADMLIDNVVNIANWV